MSMLSEAPSGATAAGTAAELVSVAADLNVPSKRVDAMRAGGREPPLEILDGAGIAASIAACPVFARPVFRAAIRSVSLGARCWSSSLLAAPLNLKGIDLGHR